MMSGQVPHFNDYIDLRQDMIGTGITMAHYMTKLQYMPWRTWLVASLVSVIQVIINDAFFWMWMLLFFAALVDWVAGRWAIRATHCEAFSHRRSREGLYGKALGLVVLALLRCMEAVLPDLLPGSVPSSHGVLASIIAVALFIDELDSIDHHRQQLGKPPIPMLSWAIERLRAITGAERREYDNATGTRRDKRTKHSSKDS